MILLDDEKKFLVGNHFIDEKTKYVFKIIKKMQLLCENSKISDVSEMFFMLTYLQTKYLYDIEMLIKRERIKEIKNREEHIRNLSVILMEIKNNINDNTQLNCENIKNLFSEWIVEQKKIDLILMKYI
jgi:hypothetical protein